MVNFSTRYAFNYMDFNLRDMFANVPSVRSAHNLSVGDTRYYLSYVYSNDTKPDYVVSGTGLHINAMGYVFGTASALSAGNYTGGSKPSFRDSWIIDKAVLDVTKLAAAAFSASPADDGALFKVIFSGNDTIRLSGGNDMFCGFGGNDILNGGGGDDFLAGDTGMDRLYGGLGVDMLHGGSGSDYFIFGLAVESGTVAANRDTILDFRRGVDKIHLSGIDANTKLSGDQTFAFHAANVKHANDIWYVKSGADVIVYGDTNGLPGAEFSILVKNVPMLSASDFIL